MVIRNGFVEQEYQILFTMNHVMLFLYVEAIVCVVTGIKVNMQGSLSLGKDVVETLSHYLGRNVISGRRSLLPAPIEDPITLAIREAQICKDLKFCQGNLHHFVNEYVVLLAKTVASIRNDSEVELSTKIYDGLKYSIKHIRKILEEANMKVENESDVYYWTHVIKRINARFQKQSHLVSDMVDAVEDNKTAHDKEDTDLRYKIVIASGFIERKYLIKLCSEHSFCSKSYQCTKALNKLLIHFKTMPKDRIRMFIKYVHEALLGSQFYRHLREATANEFQIILNDMSYANDTPAREIMLSVEKTIEARLDMIQMNKVVAVAHDILIAHVILSDIDHMYSNRSDSFTMFLNKFYDWLASDVPIEKSMRAVISDLSVQISSFEEDLVHKLIDEVVVFLEMTVTGADK